MLVAVSLFLRLFRHVVACESQRQEENVLIVERVIEVHWSALAGFPHGQKPNVFGHQHTAPWLSAQKPFRPFSEFVGPYWVKS